MAGKTTYTEEVFQAILDRMSEGETLFDICKSEGMPSRRTVQKWWHKFPELKVRIDQAREEGAEVILEECLAISDKKYGRAMSVDRDKLRIWTRFQLLARQNPAKYGTKIGIGGARELGPVETKASQLTDAELLAIASAGRNGDSEAP